MNTWTFIGHLGEDAVVSIIDGGHKVINFNVAITQKFKNREGTLVERTTWVSCSKFGEKTAVAAFLKTGIMVCVSGRPSTRAYQKKGGEIAAQLNCTVDAIELLLSKKTGEGIQEQPVSSTPASAEVAAENLAEPLDDLPF